MHLDSPEHPSRGTRAHHELTEIVEQAASLETITTLVELTTRFRVEVQQDPRGWTAAPAAHENSEVAREFMRALQSDERSDDPGYEAELLRAAAEPASTPQGALSRFGAAFYAWSEVRFPGTDLPNRVAIRRHALRLSRNALALAADTLSGDESLAELPYVQTLLRSIERTVSQLDAVDNQLGAVCRAAVQFAARASGLPPVDDDDAIE